MIGSGSIPVGLERQRYQDVQKICYGQVVNRTQCELTGTESARRSRLAKPMALFVLQRFSAPAFAFTPLFWPHRHRPHHVRLRYPELIRLAVYCCRSCRVAGGALC